MISIGSMGNIGNTKKTSKKSCLEYFPCPKHITTCDLLPPLLYYTLYLHPACILTKLHHFFPHHPSPTTHQPPPLHPTSSGWPLVPVCANACQGSKKHGASAKCKYWNNYLLVFGWGGADQPPPPWTNRKLRVIIVYGKFWWGSINHSVQGGYKNHIQCLPRLSPS